MERALLDAPSMGITLKAKPSREQDIVTDRTSSMIGQWELLREAIRAILKLRSLDSACEPHMMLQHLSLEWLIPEGGSFSG